MRYFEGADAARTELNRRIESAEQQRQRVVQQIQAWESGDRSIHGTGGQSKRDLLQRLHSLHGLQTGLLDALAVLNDTIDNNGEILR